jgi:hypothetical protein
MVMASQKSCTPPGTPVEVIFDFRKNASPMVMTAATAVEAGLDPLRGFMLDNTDDGELELLAILNDRIADGRDVSWVWDADLEAIADREQQLGEHRTALG